MKNAVLIALVVLVILFVVYQYDSSLFGLLGFREGFEDAVIKAGGAVPSGSSNGDKKPGQMDANGMAQMNQNAAAASVTYTATATTSTNSTVFGGGFLAYSKINPFAAFATNVFYAGVTPYCNATIGASATPLFAIVDGSKTTTGFSIRVENNISQITQIDWVAIYSV
jgi:hypothetical protein